MIPAPGPQTRPGTGTAQSLQHRESGALPRALLYGLIRWDRTKSNHKKGCILRKRAKVIVAGACLLALVAGGGTAAASFVISNINQITPHVRQQLRPRVVQVFGPVTDAAPFSAGPAAVAVAQVSCPGGMVPVGGGYIPDNANPPVLMTVAADAALHNGWAVIFVNLSDQAVEGIQATVQCATGGGGVTHSVLRSRASVDQTVRALKAAVH